MAIKNIHIQHFRGIKDATIDGFKRINLIAGGNNSGKTSVLDAVFMLMDMSNPQAPINVNVLRGYQPQTIDDIKTLFYDLDTSKPILFNTQQTTGENRHLSLSYSHKPDAIQYINSDGQELPTGTIVEIGVETINGDFQMEYALEKIAKGSFQIIGYNNKLQRIKNNNFSDNYIEKSQSVYHFSSRPAVTISFLDKLITNKQDEDIVSILKNIEPKLTRISIGANNIVKVDIGLSSLLPIHVMGDGIGKLLEVLVSLYNAPNSVLLIDEIENGLHYSALKNMWKAIIIAAQKFDVQVFATTHNIEVLKYLTELINEEPGCRQAANEIMYYNLKQLPDGNTKAYSYDYERFEYAITHGIEIR